MTKLDPEYAARLLKDCAQDLVLHQHLIWMLEHFEEMNGTTISLGDDNRLVDGHHRCTLVALTGRSLQVNFVFQPYHVERYIQNED
jgi:hypothetical protein